MGTLSRLPIALGSLSRSLISRLIPLYNSVDGTEVVIQTEWEMGERNGGQRISIAVVIGSLDSTLHVLQLFGEGSLWRSFEGGLLLPFLEDSYRTRYSVT